VWPDCPLTVVIDEGEPAGPVALRFGGDRHLPDDPELGAAVEPA
jgi:hypothetical protein